MGGEGGRDRVVGEDSSAVDANLRQRMFVPGGVHRSGVRMIVDGGGRGGTCGSRIDDAWRLGVEGGSPAPDG